MHWKKRCLGIISAEMKMERSASTGVGNDTASERFMMRKYIIDSITYWAKNFHLDGFRFDLMGIHDIETMNEIRIALDEIDPSIIMLGEGWNLNTNLPPSEKAVQQMRIVCPVWLISMMHCAKR